MIQVFLILVATSVVFSISFFLQLIQKKHNNKNGIYLNYDEYLSVDLIIFLFMSIAFMLPIVFLSLHNFRSNIGKLLDDSGLLLACLLFIIGKFTNYTFSKIKKFINTNGKTPNITISFLISCIVYIIILLRLGDITTAFTFLALIIGKFIWFDTTKGSLKEDLKNLLNEIKTFPFATAFMFISITVGTIIGNNAILGILFWGNMISFIVFLFYMRCNSKTS